MSSITIALVTVIFLFILILLGVHIGYSLALMSFVGVWFFTGKIVIALSILSTTAFEAIRDYIFAVLPLFVMMGAFMSNSGAAEDLYKTSNYMLRKIPGGMGIATVIANAIFAAVTGVSVASAAVFSKISTPEMLRLNYKRSFAVGSVAGSSVLGMLIPPSILLILYGMLAEVSIGKMFIAGFLPGLVMTIIFSIGIVLMALFTPHKVMNIDNRNQAAASTTEKKESMFNLFIRPLPVFILIVVVLGGIWGGFFTPTEASAVGALGGLIVAGLKGMRKSGFNNSLLETAATSASIMLLLISAQMYSRMLTMSGVVNSLSDFVMDLSVSSYVILSIFCLVLLILGCILDSSSILLLTVPIMVPIAQQLGWNLIWFGIVMVITTELGLLTPPFGMVIFAVKATMGEQVTVEEIFSGSMPFFFMMVLSLLIIIAFPIIATWLPSLM